MKAMTSHERFSRIYAHQEADRTPIVDYAWGATIERWQREGMPSDVDYRDFFGLDRIAGISTDNSPRYPVQTVEETDDYRIYINNWGVTLKKLKHVASVPEFLNFTIVDRERWSEAKARMTPDRDRIPWDYLQQNYANWRNKGEWISADLWFGFDITHSWTVGTERILMALVEDPEWCFDMFNHELSVHLELLDMVWEAGYQFDVVAWPDDMGYKQHQFFSLNTYRELLKPVHARAIEWAHKKGVKAHLHSCGDINPFLPELVEIGVDSLNPLEVKAGMDPLHIKQKYGKDLVLHGGINALLYNDINELEIEMRRIIPTMKAGGGYILSSDHSIPSSISLQDFRRFVELGIELGSYA